MAGTKITTALELVDNISGNLSKITNSMMDFTECLKDAEDALNGLNGTKVDVDSSGAAEAAKNVGQAVKSLGSSFSGTVGNVEEFKNDSVKAINAIGVSLKVMKRERQRVLLCCG